MIMEYVQVAAAEGKEEIELPLEEDKTLLLSTLSAQFPNACGLKYKTALGKNRGIRISGGQLFPPSCDGWGNTTYFCVFWKDLHSTISEANVSTSSNLCSYTIKEKYGLRSMQNGQSTSSLSTFEKMRIKCEPTSLLNEQFPSSQSAVEKMRIKREPSNSSVTSNFLSNSLRKIDCSKSLAPSSDNDYNTKMEQIVGTISELKKAYKQKLIYDFIMKSYHEFIFDKPDALPKHIVEYCERNILQEKVGYFIYPNNICDKKLYEAIFAAPLPTNEEPLDIKDARVLQRKLFEHIAEQARKATDCLEEIKGYDFFELIKPQPVKPGTIFTDEQLFIMSKSREIKSTHDKCKEMTNHIKGLLEELSDYRQTVHPRLNKEIVESLKIQADLVEKKARCLNAEIIKKIQEEDPTVTKALQQLSSYLSSSVDRKTYQLAKLKEQRTAYDKVKGEKFSEMVTKYRSLVEKTNRQIILYQMYSQDSPSNISDRSYIESDDD